MRTYSTNKVFRLILECILVSAMLLLIGLRANAQDMPKLKGKQLTEQVALHTAEMQAYITRVDQPPVIPLNHAGKDPVHVSPANAGGCYWPENRTAYVDVYKFSSAYNYTWTASGQLRQTIIFDRYGNSRMRTILRIR